MSIPQHAPCAAVTAAVLVATVAVAEAAAQPADTLVAPVPMPVRFEEARALAVDPAGTLYVADAGADVVVRLSPAGIVQERLGGPGSGAGQFHDPAAVDPTNGLVLLVADAGNGRIQRFTRDFRHLETLTVGRGFGAGDEAPPAVYDAGASGSGTDALGFGRPVAVASTAADETFAINAAAGVVLRWGPGGSAPHVVGGFAAGAGTLRAPTALAVAPRGRLFVADVERAAILAYDSFGSFMGVLVAGLDAPVQALTIQDRQLWIVLPGRLLVCNLRGRRLRTVRAALNAPLVDAAHYGDTLFLLTAHRLYRAVWP